MRFPGNCLIVALTFAALPGNRLRTKRNRMGRLHFFWTDKRGRSWEFYKKGAGSKTYIENALYLGEVRRTL